MEAKRLRVLVVDDYCAWRSFICSTLRQHSNLCIVGEAIDGSEAIQKIQELQPDLVVLDIGLPKLNGLEVAHQIRELSPATRVLVVSETRPAEIAEEAFRRGALGYVVKSGAATELLPAVDAVLEGEQFISAHLIGSVFENSRQEKSLTNPGDRDTIAHAPSPNCMNKHLHEVEFFAEDAAYVAGLARYVEAALKRGDPAVVVATAPHWASLLETLKGDGVDVEALIERGALLLLDSVETLSSIMVDDRPDPVLCEQALGTLIGNVARNAAGAHPHVCFCGQCAPVLLSRGNTEGAIQLEHMWDEITRAYGADTLCCYVWNAVPNEDRQNVVRRICAVHSRVHGLESSYSHP